MPGTYDADTRTVRLTTAWDGHQHLPTATVIHLVVNDLLSQNSFPGAHLPEMVDLAVIATGLGVVQSHLDLVSQSASFWDPTAWEVLPPPFLDAQKSAYAHALAAWVREETAPAWSAELTGQVSAPMSKSLKFLTKTRDSFFAGSEKGLAQFTPAQWQEVAATDLLSAQVIGLRHCFVPPENSDADQIKSGWAALLIERFRSRSVHVVLHAIGAAERGAIDDPAVIDELVILAEHRDDVVKAKAMLALTQMGRLASESLELAARMLDSSEKFVTFAGLFAMASTDEVPDQAMPALDRAFSRALANCDQELINLFANGYKNWMADPAEYFHELFAERSPEYVEIAIEALETSNASLVSLE